MLLKGAVSCQNIGDILATAAAVSDDVQLV